MRTVTVVVGANGGIGSRCVKQLVSRGDCVAYWACPESAISELEVTLPMPFKIVDPTDAIAMTNALQEIAEKHHIKAVVNCVGSIMLFIHLLTANDWQTTLNTNLNSAFACVQAAVSDDGQGVGK